MLDLLPTITPRTLASTSVCEHVLLHILVTCVCLLVLLVAPRVSGECILELLSVQDVHFSPSDVNRFVERLRLSANRIKQINSLNRYVGTAKMQPGSYVFQDERSCFVNFTFSTYMYQYVTNNTLHLYMCIAIDLLHAAVYSWDRTPFGICVGQVFTEERDRRKLHFCIKRINLSIIIVF